MQTQHERRLKTLAVVALICSVAVGCEQHLTGPALPAPPARPFPNGLRTFTVSWAGAAPVGDCMADRLNDEMARSPGWWQKVKIEQEGSAISFDFNYSGDEFFDPILPLSYSGQVDGQGEVEAVVLPRGLGYFEDWSKFGTKPRCYTEYDKLAGRLTATISADESIVGTVEDTFKAIPGGQVFTVKTTFTTWPPG